MTTCTTYKEPLRETCTTVDYCNTTTANDGKMDDINNDTTATVTSKNFTISTTSTFQPLG
jgi:hypothetical protein